MGKHKALVRLSPDRKRFTILCAQGHLIDNVMCDRSFGGSVGEAELGSYQAGRPNRFDRLAENCEAGHEPICRASN